MADDYKSQDGNPPKESYDDARDRVVWIRARLDLDPPAYVRETTMASFSFDIGEKERVGSRFLSDVRDELQRALATEKSHRKITQQEIADLLETSRAVINRQIMGLENIGIKRAAEILWAIGWEPHFEARPIPKGENSIIHPTARAPVETVRENRGVHASALGNRPDETKSPSAADLAYAQ